MAVLESLLRSVRAQGSALWRVRMEPGSERVVPVSAALNLCGVVAGDLTIDGAAVVPGGVVMLRGERSVVVKAGDSGATLLVCAYHAADGGRRPAEALPEVAAVPPGGPDCVTLLELLDRGVNRDAAPVVRDRLLDWLLTCTLHEFFARPAPERPPWYAALTDPVVGPALVAMRDEPARRWTVTELAALGGSGRAAFASRFRSLVGSSPLAHLRDWRMTLAAERLADPRTTVSAVARSVGYADAFTFSAAFKRERGVAPSALRRAVESDIAVAGPAPGNQEPAHGAAG